MADLIRIIDGVEVNISARIRAKKVADAALAAQVGTVETSVSGLQTTVQNLNDVYSTDNETIARVAELKTLVDTEDGSLASAIQLVQGNLNTEKAALQLAINEKVATDAYLLDKTNMETAINLKMASSTFETEKTAIQDSVTAVAGRVTTAEGNIESIITDLAEFTA